MKLARSKLCFWTRRIPEIRCESQGLTSFAGLVLFQALFQRLDLRRRLRRCLRKVISSSTYGLHTILLVVIVHLILGWHRLRDVVYYRDDALVLRVLGLHRLPDASTITRGLRKMAAPVVRRLRALNRGLVLDRVLQEDLPRLTLDYDGSVLSTKSRNTEGTAVGFNPKAKGARSYYPLFCTLAQTGQVLDLEHRPGNVHDSHDAVKFQKRCFRKVRKSGFRGVLEARLDSAHFSDEACLAMDAEGVQFSVSVPFERFPQLKDLIERRERWNRINDIWSYFEGDWKPESWPRGFRCLVYRQKVKVPRRGPIQLDLFVPVHWQFEYKAVITNRVEGAAAVLEFHNGRGSQEALFGQLKSQLHMEYLPTRRLVANQTYLACVVLAHNLYREIQMDVRRPMPRNALNRACMWVFEHTASLRKRLIQRAGRLTRPRGVLTLNLSANKSVADQLKAYLQALRGAA